MLTKYFKSTTIKSIQEPLKTFRKNNIIEELINVSITTPERDIKASITMLPENLIRLNCQDEETFCKVYFKDSEVKEAVSVFNSFLENGDIETVLFLSRS